MQIGQATLMLQGESSESLMQVASTLTIATAGLDINTAIEHVATIEGILNLITVLSPALNPLLNPVTAAAAFVPLLTAAFATASVPLQPTLLAPLAAYFANPLVIPGKVAGASDGLQTAPGMGSISVLTG